MADFNGADINSMRQDAIRRAREMQMRSQSYVNRPGSVQKPIEPQKDCRRPQQEQSSCGQQSRPGGSPGCRDNRQPPPPNMGFNPFGALFGGGTPSAGGEASKGTGPISGILNQLFPGKGIKLDEDRIILVILIILLAREGADLKLLLALGYLLM